MAIRLATLPGRLLRLGATLLLALAALSAAAGTPPFFLGPVPSAPGTYYTIDCREDRIEVSREVPTTETIKLIALYDVMALSVGAQLNLGDFMTLELSSEDTVVIYGSNGNAAPDSGSETFSLIDCTQHNGGEPPAPIQPPEGDPPGDAETGCGIRCALCPSCLIEGFYDDDACVNIAPGFCYPLDFIVGPCSVLCYDVCTGFIADFPGLELGGSESTPTPRAKRPFPPGESVVGLLYAVRQEILATSAAGRHYTDLFYLHNDEIVRLLAMSWSRWRQGYETIGRFVPHLLALVQGRGTEVVISAEDVQAVEDFLDHLAVSASPQLASTLAAERAEAQLARFVGQTMEDARAALVGAATCPDTPDPACASVAKGSLVVDEHKAGKEKLVAKLKGGPALTQVELGDPTFAGPPVSLCLYDEAGASVGALGVDRAGALCGRKPCWKALGKAPPAGKGFAYKDADSVADGVTSLQLKGGSAGRSKFQVKARNRGRKGANRLPDGLAAALASASSVTVQLHAGGGVCVGTQLNQIQKQDATRFKAR